MAQGQTLTAAVAYCGDATALPGLTEMLTTYVILSRVRTADSLLLMRAFSHYLFRLGNSPGPRCLEKLLRARFPQLRESVPKSEHYGPVEARAEYKALAKIWEDLKELQKKTRHGVAMFRMPASVSRGKLRWRTHRYHRGAAAKMYCRWILASLYILPENRWQYEPP